MTLTIDTVLYLIAIALFVWAFWRGNKNGWSPQWLAFAVLVLSLII